MYAGANTLLRKFASCSKYVKLLLVESYCCNFYCGSLWTSYTIAALHKLKVAYNNVFRKVLGHRSRDSASMMFVTNGIDNFESRMRKSCYGFRKRLLDSDNNVLISMNGHSWLANNYMFGRWHSMLSHTSTTV